MAGINDVLFGSDVLRDQQIPGVAMQPYAPSRPPGTGFPAPAPAPAPTTPPASSTPAPTTETTVDPITDELAKALSDMNPGLGNVYKKWKAERGVERKRLTDKEEKQETAITEAQGEAQKTVQGIIDKNRTDYEKVEKEMPKPFDKPYPTQPPLDKPPDMTLRPFGKVKPGDEDKIFENLNMLVSTLGLLGQQATGLNRGFARGALAAYEGALQGWAEGDKVRAEREWLNYSHKMDKMREDHKSLVEEYNAAYEKYGHDMDRLKVHLGIINAEHNLDQQQVELAFTKPHELMRQAEHTSKLIERADQGTDAVESKMLTMKMVKESAKARQDAQLDAYAPGEWIDSQGHEITTPTKRDIKDNPGRYHKLNSSEATMYYNTATALRMVDDAGAIVEKVLASKSPENLARGLEGKAAEQLRNDPDWGEFFQLMTETNVELARVVGGSGQLRTTVVNMLRESGVKGWDTKTTAHRILDTIKASLVGRRTSIETGGKAPAEGDRYPHYPTAAAGRTGSSSSSPITPINPNDPLGVR